MLFQKSEGDAAILVTNGVYKQADVYTRQGELYAALNGGFVRLNADGSTTYPKCRLDTLSWEKPLYRSAMGRLLAEPNGKSTPLQITEEGQLRLENGNS